jgi:starch synthase
MKTLNVLSVASEAVPLVKTGGLADVVGALPAALAPHGVKLTSLLPGFPSVMQAVLRGKLLHKYDNLLGQEAKLVAGKLGDYPLIVLDAPAFFAREGSPYADRNGKDWQDNWRRFAALGRAAADLAGGLAKTRKFDLLHAHDWQAALALAYMRFAPYADSKQVPSVMTVHNMAFQGYYGRAVFKELGLPKSAWAIDGVEYHKGVGFLKAGMEAASIVTTVSPTYAQEIRNPEFGMGLEGLVVNRGDRVRGIVNGIDPAEWNPATDPHLAVTYTAHTVSKRIVNKRALEAEFGLEPGDGPLFVVISRLTWQKGMDVLLEVLDHLVGIGGRLALLGSGDAVMEDEFRAAAARHPGRIGVRIGYDEALSHKMQGGGDAILVPSRFEPCGLTQLYGLAYGCMPVVARTGGLADTVIDANFAACNAGAATGIQFSGVDYPTLASAVSRTVTLYHQPEAWTAIQREGMKADFSWTNSGKVYADLYRELTGAK